MPWQRQHPVPTKYCMREDCGERLARRPSEPPSMYRKRWFCSRLCASAMREHLSRRPPSYDTASEPYRRAVAELARTHSLELYCLHRSAVLADGHTHDRVESTQLPLIELNEQEAAS